MKRIEGFRGNAKKSSDDGQIVYELWVDEHGELFVRFNDNDVNTDRPGTFSSILYPVKEYANKRNSKENIGHPTGIDMTTKKAVTPSDNNNGSFLKAVLRDLLPP
jgi:hypothetical protein